MQTNKLLGIVLLVAGIALAVYGYNQQNSIGSQVGEFLGHENKNAVMYIAAGAVGAVIGIVLLLKGGGKN